MEYAGKAGRPLDGLDVKSFFDGLVFFGPVALLVRTAAGVTVGQFFLLQAALSMGQLLVNFFYADKLAACGLRREWMTPVILGYSALQMLAAPLLRCLGRPGHRTGRSLYI